MKQYNIINLIVKELVDNNYIDCAFLMGSFARQKEDDYSNIDLYLKIKLEKEDEFYKNNLHILEKYNSIIYYQFKDNINLIVIYKDQVNLNIHLTDLKNVNITNDIMKLYDPFNLLIDILNYNLEYNYLEIGNIINNMSLACFNFLRYYLRNDLAIMLKIASEIHEDYTIIIRYYKDKQSSKLKEKEILSILNENERIRYIEILKNFKYDTIKKCVYMMMEDISNVITLLPVEVAINYDYDFFIYVMKNIKKF